MDAFTETLTAALARYVDGFEQLVSAERLSGGASQETYRIDAVAAGRAARYALRRAPGGESGHVEGRPGLAVEAKLMQVAKAAGVPEPEVRAVLSPSDGLGDGFLMDWLDGETLGARIVRSPVLDEVRPLLARQCGEILATIHGIDPVVTGLAPHLQTVSTEEFVTEMWQQYRDLATPQPMIDFTARWLLDHLPPEVGPRLVHNDFRNGNLMVDAERGVIAVLDWEVCHLGDPVRDLGWICTNSWRFGRRDQPVGGFGHYDDLFAGYSSVSGTAVDPEHVRFWEVFGSFWWSIGCLKMADHYRNGPDPTVERPAIGRRSSECQVDCVNLLIPGPVELVTGRSGAAPSSSVDLPATGELVTSVRDFLRGEVGDATSGRTGFLSRVAANSLDIVLRELDLGPAHCAAEQARLRALLAASGSPPPAAADLNDLRRALVERLRAGTMPLDHDGLADHLRTTVVNQAGIDQPTYSGYRAAILGGSAEPPSASRPGATGPGQGS
jgi:aminoglycoside phosphotransferase (APT) family kinase protein